MISEPLPDNQAPPGGAPADPPSRWKPLLSWRDHPALLEQQRLLRDVDRAASAALDAMHRSLTERGSMAGAHETELMNAQFGRMTAAQASAAEAGDALYRFRIGEV